MSCDGKKEWGEPQVGFVEIEEEEDPQPNTPEKQKEESA